jgi:hypothetical protein
VIPLCVYIYIDKSENHLIQPPPINFLEEFGIHINKTPPKVHFKSPRLRLHRPRHATTQPLEFLLVLAHDQYQVFRNNDLCTKDFFKGLYTQTELLMNRPLTIRHILGYELKFPTSAPIVEKRAHRALFHAEHQRVEVRSTPEAQDGESCGWVLCLEGAGFLDDEVAVKGRGVVHVREVLCGGDAGAEVEVEVYGAVGFGGSGYEARGSAAVGGADYTCAENWREVLEVMG